MHFCYVLSSPAISSTLEQWWSGYGEVLVQLRGIQHSSLWAIECMARWIWENPEENDFREFWLVLAYNVVLSHYAGAEEAKQEDEDEARW